MFSGLSRKKCVRGLCSLICLQSVKKKIFMWVSLEEANHPEDLWRLQALGKYPFSFEHIHVHEKTNSDHPPNLI